jgi:poly-gamma-glutamate capsule biosynthesis protein CapA/YwtB (metallophosphatase superfamily)
MFRKTLACLILFSLQFSLTGQQSGDTGNILSLLFIGDIMGHDTQIKSAENGETGTWDYNDVFMYIKPLISDADIAIANFEVTLAGPPYKGYPQFSSPAALADACRNAGIDYLVTANNHAADRGKNGITGTINRLDSLGIPHTGTFLNKTARDSLYPLIINKRGFNIALLNYTYGTNGIKVQEPVIVNMFDRTLIAGDIEKAKNKKADFIILFLHWGIEYDTIPSEIQIEMAGYFFSCGADLIIGSHPHVLQKMILFRADTAYNNKAVIYSLGNFVSNQRKPGTDGGSMVKIDLEKKNASVSISNAGYYLTWVYTPVDNFRQRFFILPCSEFENRPGFFQEQKDYLQMKRFLYHSRSFLYKQNINVKEYIFNGNNWLLNN